MNHGVTRWTDAELTAAMRWFKAGLPFNGAAFFGAKGKVQSVMFAKVHMERARRNRDRYERWKHGRKANCPQGTRPSELR